MIQIVWFRRILRLDDHPALIAALAAGGPVIPLFIAAPEEARAQPASAWRQALSLPHLAGALAARGSRLITRIGAPARVLADLARETGASQIHATSGFPFAPLAADQAMARDLAAAGVTIRFHDTPDLAPRGAVLTGQGSPYKVFTPFWRALQARPIPAPLAAPARLPAPELWPDSAPPDWPAARAAMRRGAEVVAAHSTPGEGAALARLEDFLTRALPRYGAERNFPDLAGACSGLSDALAIGEISPRRIWHQTRAAEALGAEGAGSFLSELAWRDFARDLLWHNPAMDHQVWRAEWADFPWRGDPALAEPWRRAETGVDLVDAGLRELFVTGRIHNRVRMVVASYLTKHLRIDWRIGLDWFAQTLSDWDAASNAMNWQWVAGCGPDAAPFFRIFNPDGQAQKFDPKGGYRDYWLNPARKGAQDFAAAAPLRWQVDLHRRPLPAISLAEGRAQALSAYEQMKRGGAAQGLLI